MKSFKTYIREVAIGTGSSGIARYNDSLHRIDDKAVQARVNTWLQANSNMEFATVEAALYQLTAKLEQIGLTFSVQAEAAGDSGSLRLPLKQWGGRFGKDTDTGHNDFINDDGISYKIEGNEMVLSIDYERMPTGGFRVTGQIQ